MICKTVFSVVFTLLMVSTNCENRLSDNVALFWNLYDSVVTGSRILHDITEGVGAVSNAIKAIDAFLDTNTEQLGDAIAEATLDETGIETEPLITPDKPRASVAEKCGINSAKGGRESCKSKPDVLVKEQSVGKEPDVPKFNGCGALGFHIRDTNLPVTKMTDCCVVQDACYSASCRSNKRDCDGKLRNCLFSVCDDKSVQRTSQKSCRAAAKLLFSGTMALSFQQYSDAQKLLNCPG